MSISSLAKNLVFLILVFHFSLGFSQANEFPSFLNELENKPQKEMVVSVPDSLVSMNEYELKWAKIKGTYGGSSYYYEGRTFEVHSEAQLNDIITNSDQFMLPLSAMISKELKMIGDQYLMTICTYPEPRPTSNVHYVYITRYYQRIGSNVPLLQKQKTRNTSGFEIVGLAKSKVSY
ncbi:MAG: hypothetical protein EP338_09735 [Bacteroidetes bacterium]|nr:MAG: hypothetical protein EP338_09735 [Bacteroidota bacterium]